MKNLKTMLSILLTLAIVMTMSPVVFAASSGSELDDNSVTINVPSGTFEVKDAFKFQTTINGDFTEARVKSGGEVVKTFTKDAEKTTYEITLDADAPKYVGENEIEVEVSFSDGTTKKATEKVSTYSEIIPNILQTNMNKFPASVTTATNSNDAVSLIWRNIIGGTTSDGSSAAPLGIKYEKVTSVGSGDNITTGVFLKAINESSTTGDLGYFDSPIFSNINSGVLRATVNVFPENATRDFRIMLRGLKKQDGSEVSGGYVYKNMPLINGKWNKLTVEFIFNENGGDWIYTREVNGVDTKRDIHKVSYSELSQINQVKFYTLCASDAGDQYHYYDSFRIEHATGENHSVSLTGYKLAGTGEIAVENATAHSAAQALVLTANNKVDSVSADSKLFDSNGNVVDGVQFAANKNTIEVSVPGQSMLTGAYKVVLGADTVIGGSEVGGKFCAEVNFENTALNIISLNVPDGTYSVKDSITFSTTIYGDFTEARVKSGGEVVKTFTQDAQKTTYEITVNADAPKYIGENVIEVEVDFADGTTKSATKNISTYSEIAPTSILQTNMNNFPASVTSATLSTDVVKLIWRSIAGTTTTDGSNADPLGIKYEKVTSAGSGNNVTTGVFLKAIKESNSSGDLSYFDSHIFNNINSGVLRATVNVFPENATRDFRIHLKGLKKQDGNDVSGGYALKNMPLINGKWNKLTVEFIFNENGGKWIYTREVEGEATKQDTYNVSYQELSQINQVRFYTLCASDQGAQFQTFESFKVEHTTGAKYSLDLTGYKMPGGEKTAVNNATVNNAAETLILTANDTVDYVSEESKLLDANGVAVDGVQFVSNGNTVEVSLPGQGIPSGAYNIVLGADTVIGEAEVGGKLCATVNFENKDFQIIYPVNGARVEGDAITIKATAPGAVNVSAFIDGVLLERKAANQSGVYTFNAASLDAGLKEVIITANYSDKTTRKATSIFGLYAQETDNYITKTSYSKDSENFDTNVIPNDADSVSLVMATAPTVSSDEDVTIFVDGVEVAHGGASAEGNAVKVNLPQNLKANSILKVKYGNVSASYYVCGANGFYIDVASYQYTTSEEGTPVFGAMLHFAGLNNSSVSKGIVAAYDGNRVVNVALVNIPAATGHDFINLGIDVTAETDKVGIMVWDSMNSLKPLMDSANFAKN